MSTTTTARKRPGRPRKKVEANTTGVMGIVATPVNSANCVELVYNQPILLRHIVSIFKEYDSAELTFEFHPTHIEIIGVDHSERIHIRITVNAADMNQYYFNDPTKVYCIAVKRDNLEIVVASIEKSHYKLQLALQSDDLTILHIVMSNSEYDNDDGYEVEVVPKEYVAADGANTSDDLTTSTYPIEFTLDARHLRRKITELRKVSKQMIVRKCKNKPLEITFGDVARVVYTGVYKSPAKIKFRSSLTENEMFMASIDIEQIRPLLAVNLPGNISIFADTHRPMTFKVGLDYRDGDAGSGSIAAAPAPVAAAAAATTSTTPVQLSPTEPHFAIIARLFITTTR